MCCIVWHLSPLTFLKSACPPSSRPAAIRSEAAVSDWSVTRLTHTKSALTAITFILWAEKPWFELSDVAHCNYQRLIGEAIHKERAANSLRCLWGQKVSGRGGEDTVRRRRIMKVVSLGKHRHTWKNVIQAVWFRGIDNQSLQAQTKWCCCLQSTTNYITKHVQLSRPRLRVDCYVRMTDPL